AAIRHHERAGRVPLDGCHRRDGEPPGRRRRAGRDRGVVALLMRASPSRKSPAPPRLSDRRKRSWWPFVTFGVFLLAAVIVGLFVDVSRHLHVVQAWADALGTLAPVAYIVVYVVATLIGLPGTPITLLAPFLFGVVPAILIMVVGSILSAAFGFLIARYFA